MRVSSFAVWFLAAASELVHTVQAQAQINTITVNDLVNPITVNTSTPTFGWTLGKASARGSQFSGVQIKVWAAITPATILWDSGTVTTTTSTQQLVYSGTTLLARRNYGFQLRLQDSSAGVWTAWVNGSFGTGLFAAADWGSAQWIGGANPIVDQPLLRTSFNAPKTIYSAKLFITALGAYEAYLNGNRVGDLYLTPGWTTYSKRSYYDTYDITNQVKSGNNAIMVAVGKYWFGTIYTYGAAAKRGAWDGKMRAKAQILITYSDGTSQTIVTDRSWKTRVSGSVCNSTSPDTEYFNARSESSLTWATTAFDASSWADAIVQTPPYTEVQSNPIEPVRVIETYKAVSITNPAAKAWVFDFGQNIAGVGALTINEPAGTVVSMRYGEKLTSGRVQKEGRKNQYSYYVSAGKGSETWTPRFTYYGFQYIEITGVTKTPQIGTITAKRLHSDFKTVGRFATSNTLLQWIYDVTLQTIRNNVMGVPTDGSDNEKLPWTADGALMAEVVFSTFNAKAIFTRWMQDIADTQYSNGDVASWSPSPLDMTPLSSAAWGSSFPETAWNLYQHYGDVDVLRRHYSSMKAYVNFELNARGKEGLVGLESWGDWVTPSINDKALAGTAYIYRSITKLIDIASVLGFQADATTFTASASQVNASFHKAFYQSGTGDYRSSSSATFVQTDNLLPVAFGMTNVARRAAIIDKVAANVVSNSNHLTTGVLGTKWILPILSQYGYTDLAYLVATQTTAPSWGFWKTRGATTLWEEWRATSRSVGHQFLGTVVDWFYQYLAGIKITEPGYKSVSITPYAPKDLKSAQATIQTLRGPVSSSWTKTSTQFDIGVEIPSGTTGVLNLPAFGGNAVSESGGPVSTAKGVTSLGTKNGRISFRLTSGSYQFSVK